MLYRLKLVVICVCLLLCSYVFVSVVLVECMLVCLLMMSMFLLSDVSVVVRFIMVDV